MLLKGSMGSVKFIKLAVSSVSRGRDGETHESFSEMTSQTALHCKSSFKTGMQNSWLCRFRNPLLHCQNKHFLCVGPYIELERLSFVPDLLCF